MKTFLNFFIISIFLNVVFCGKILQLTDFHYDVDYNIQGQIKNFCHLNLSDYDKNRNLGNYGNYMCDSPRILIKHALTNAIKIIPNPNFILWTGDNVPHIEHYDNKYTESAINTTTNLINHFYPDTVVLPVFGNHDYAPANCFPDNGSDVYEFAYNLWKKWIPESQKENFLKAGYYTYSQPGGNITFLMLNTNLYYRFNSANFTEKNDPGSQFAFMDSVLSVAKKENKFVHVVAHIAPGVFERTPNFTWMPENYNRKFLDLTVKYSDTIKWMIFGHHHTDTFHIVKNAKNEPVQLMLMAPSVTPWFSDLEGAGSNNPAFRIIDYDEKTWEYNDIETYYIDLDQLNNNQNTNWTLEYSFKDDYGLNAINAKTMFNLLQQFKINDTIFLKYMEYNSVKWKPELPKNKFRSAQLCSIEFPDLKDYQICMENGGISANNVVMNFFSIIAMVLLIV